MEYITIINVNFPFGAAFTRLSLDRLLRSVGIETEEILLDVSARRAVVGLSDTYAVQDAVIKLDGISFFGETLRLVVSSTAPALWRGGAFRLVTMRPTSCLLVQGTSPDMTTSLLVCVRRMSGAVSVTSCSQTALLVDTRDVPAAVRLRSWILAALRGASPDAGVSIVYLSFNASPTRFHSRMGISDYRVV